MKHIIDSEAVEKLKRYEFNLYGDSVFIKLDDLRALIASSPKADDLVKDAERWRKGVEDKEFGVYSNGQYMHVSRKDGKIIFGNDYNELMDNVIAHDQAIDEAMKGK